MTDQPTTNGPEPPQCGCDGVWSCPQHARFLRPFNVFDGTVLKGVVWCEAGAQDEGRWRASDPTGQVEWRPWAFHPTIQAAAKACVAAFDGRMSRFQNDWAS